MMGTQKVGVNVKLFFLYSLLFRFISDRIESVFDNYL